MIDKIALETAREIENLPKDWPEVRRVAAIQTIITNLIKRLLNEFR